MRESASHTPEAVRFLRQSHRNCAAILKNRSMARQHCRPANMGMRTVLETWFDQKGVRPQVIGEFEDSALMEVRFVGRARFYGCALRD
jgi:hypothetical protein